MVERNRVECGCFSLNPTAPELRTLHFQISVSCQIPVLPAPPLLSTCVNNTKDLVTQSRSCSLWYIFHSLINFIQRLWCWDMTFQVIVLVILWVLMGACSSPRIEFVFYLVVQWQGEKTSGLWCHTDPGLNPGLPLTDFGQTTQPLWISLPHLICKMGGSHSTGFCEVCQR